jgi:hypothetical protein
VKDINYWNDFVAILPFLNVVIQIVEKPRRKLLDEAMINPDSS